MNAPFALTVDKHAFVAWLEHQDGRYEWKDGRVVPMTTATKAHDRIAANVMFAFGARLDRELWSITLSDLGVEDETYLRFPDVIIEPMDADDKSRRAERASILVEVMSPSSVGIDMTEKPEEYCFIPSLRAYIVASQDEPILWVWQRDPRTGAFPARPTEIAGREQSLALAFETLSIPLAELYRGIATG